MTDEGPSAPDWGRMREYAELEKAYQESGRCAECPDDDACELERIEVQFAIPVLMTQEQQGRLLDLLDEIVKSPFNQPREGVHWVGFIGSKMSYSAADAALLGRAPGPEHVENGAEPVSDDTVYCVESSARSFASRKEREKIMRERDAS